MTKVNQKVKSQINEKLNEKQQKELELRQDLKDQSKKLTSYHKFKTLHKELNHHSYTSQYYWAVFIARRIVFLTVCIYSRDSYWQSAFYLSLSMLASSYLYAIFPFEGTRRNYIENLNELIIFVCALLQMVLVGCNIKSKPRQSLSNLIIAGISFMIVANLVLFVADIAH